MRLASALLETLEQLRERMGQRPAVTSFLELQIKQLEGAATRGQLLSACLDMLLQMEETIELLPTDLAPHLIQAQRDIANLAGDPSVMPDLRPRVATSLKRVRSSLQVQGGLFG